MTTPCTLALVKIEDLLVDSRTGPWEDPETIAAMSPEKRETLLANPLRARADVAQILAIVDGRVAGRIELLRGRLIQDGTPMPVCWLSNHYVSSRYRRRGIGIALIDAASQLAPQVGVVGISEISRSLYLRLGWTGHDIPRYVHPFRVEPILKGAVGEMLGGTLAILARGPISATDAAARAQVRSASRGLVVEKLPIDRSDLDELLARPRKTLEGFRSVGWIHWLLEHDFQREPNRTMEAFLVRDAAQDPVAYFLVAVRPVNYPTRIRTRSFLHGALKDWRIFREDRMSEITLVHLAAAILRNHGVDTIGIHSFAPRMGSRLLPFGYLRSSSLAVRFSPASRIVTPTDPTAWNLQPADGDNAFS